MWKVMSRPLQELSIDEFDFDDKVEIGRGDVGKVLSVPWNGKRVAVKVLFKIEIGNHEASMLAKVSHRNIVEYYGIVAYRNRKCVVTELADFGSLGNLLYKRDPLLKLNESLRSQWTLDVARGLSYLHSELEPSISHGDLKTPNILIFDGRKGPTAKLCDFGKGRLMEGTASVQSFGSLLWSAPEILNWQGQSLLSDVWSFGATVVEIFTNQKPYAHLSDQNKDVLFEVKEGRLTPLSQLDREQLSQIPPVVRGLLSQCFEHKHERRISMSKIVACLSDDQKTSVVESQAKGSDATTQTMSRASTAKNPQAARGQPHGAVAAKSVATVATAPPKIARYHVWWWMDHREHFDLDLPFQGKVLGQELRAALAENREVLPAECRLRQRRSRRKKDGTRLVAVEGLCFANQAGEVASWSDMEDEELHLILDDEEVPTAGPLRALVVVERK